MSETIPGCLLCGAPLPPWNPHDPDPEEFERTLICLRHPLGDLLREGLPIYRCDEACIARIESEVRNKRFIRCWATSGYFSLLIELEDSRLLRVYPSQRWPEIICFARQRLCPSAPRGLIALARGNLGQIRGPCDRLPAKAGVEELLDVIEEGVPVVQLQKPNDTLAIRFPDRELTITATGWIGGVFLDPKDVRKAVDLDLKWRRF